MMEDERAERLEAEYGMPPGRLMYHFYRERDMSAGDIAAELDESRYTVQYWLTKAGIEMRSRRLTDVQRVLIMAYMDAGLGDKAIASRVDCGFHTVRRYRKEIESTGEPVDLTEGTFGADDIAVLEHVVESAVGPRRGGSGKESSCES